MAREEFEIEVDRQGNVTIRTIGIKGPACVDAAENLARIIGRQESSQLTPEYYENSVDQNSHVDIRHNH